MKKWISGIILIALLILTGIDCFAQSTDARIRALQGEWRLTHMQMEEEVIDLTVPPFNEVMEQIWKFEGNNLFVLTIDLQTGESEAETSTFTIIGNTLLLSDQRRTDTAPYTLQGNTLIITSTDYIFTLRKL